MGDSRLRFQILKTILQSESESEIVSTNHQEELLSFSDSWAADSTVHDVLEGVDSLLSKQSAVSLRSLLDHGGASIWDCTVHPAKNITEIFVSRQKASTSTLYSLGWFPSGSIQILTGRATGMISGQTNKYDDVQYCNSTETLQSAPESSKTVRLKGIASDALPSQVFQSVRERFSDETNEKKMAADFLAQENRRMNKVKKKEADQSRSSKLDDRINKLRQKHLSGKKKSVSDQVQRMLMKSRATGRPELKAEDRVYFVCALVDESDDRDNGSEVFRFFSRQDTVGRALESFPKKNDRSTELLVEAHSDDGEHDTVYRRLPTGMRFYEAIANSYLTGSMDAVVVRGYVRHVHEATPSISEGATCPADSDPEISNKVPSDTIEPPAILSLHSIEQDKLDFETVKSRKYRSIENALMTLQKSSTKPKKTTTAVAKVREMKMKSKGLGEPNRVKMPERFFIELVVTEENSNTTHADDLDRTCVIHSYFSLYFAKSDSLNRIFRDIDLGTKYKDPSRSWELLNACNEDHALYRHVASSQDVASHTRSWASARDSGLVKSFDRVVLHFSKSKLLFI